MWCNWKLINKIRNIFATVIRIFTSHFLIVQRIGTEKGPLVAIKQISPSKSSFIFGSKVIVNSQFKPADSCPGGWKLKNLKIESFWATIGQVSYSIVIKSLRRSVNEVILHVFIEYEIFVSTTFIL